MENVKHIKWIVYILWFALFLYTVAKNLDLITGVILFVFLLLLLFFVILLFLGSSTPYSSSITQKIIYSRYTRFIALFVFIGTFCFSMYHIYITSILNSDFSNLARIEKSKYDNTMKAYYDIYSAYVNQQTLASCRRGDEVDYQCAHLILRDLKEKVKESTTNILNTLNLQEFSEDIHTHMSTILIEQLGTQPTFSKYSFSAFKEVCVLPNYILEKIVNREKVYLFCVEHERQIKVMKNMIWFFMMVCTLNILLCIPFLRVFTGKTLKTYSIQHILVALLFMNSVVIFFHLNALQKTLFHKTALKDYYIQGMDDEFEVIPNFKQFKCTNPLKNIPNVDIPMWIKSVLSLRMFYIGLVFLVHWLYLFTIGASSNAYVKRYIPLVFLVYVYIFIVMFIKIYKS